MTYVDPSRWFDPVGKCRCGKPATGVLRGDQNQSMGPYCEKCATARIKQADKQRAALGKRASSDD